jgi:hypothetical protein
MQATGKKLTKIRAILQNQTVRQANHMQEAELGLLLAWLTLWS